MFCTLLYQPTSGSIMWSDLRRGTTWTKGHCSICRCSLTMVLVKWHDNAHFTCLFCHSNCSNPLNIVKSFSKVPTCIQIQGFVGLALTDSCSVDIQRIFLHSHRVHHITFGVKFTAANFPRSCFVQTFHRFNLFRSAQIKISSQTFQI